MTYNKLLIKDIAQIVLLSIITLILNFVAITSPIIFFICSVISIIPIVIITVKYKEKISFIVCVCILIVLTLIGQPFYEILIKFFVFSIVGISIGYGIRRHLNFKETLILGTFASVMSFILSFLIVLAFEKINIINELYIHNTLEFFKAFNITNNLSDLATRINQTNVNEYIDKMLQFDSWWIILFTFELFILLAFLGGANLNLLFLVIPSTLIIVAAVVCSFIIRTWVVISKSKYQNSIEPFALFKLPNGFGIAFIIIQLLLWMSNYQQGTINIWVGILVNMMLIFNFAFMMQGLSVIEYKMRKIGLKGNIILVFYIVSSLLLFSVIVIMGLIILGIFDYIFNFRKLETY